jgi:hypothetical protein
VDNLVHAHRIPAAAFGALRTLMLPGLSVTIGEMIDALRASAGDDVAARIRFEPDPAVARIVMTWPARLDASRARALGCVQDVDFAAILRQYRAEAGV